MSETVTAPDDLADDALQDAPQDAPSRAWRGLPGFRGRRSLRTRLGAAAGARGGHRVGGLAQPALTLREGVAGDPAALERGDAEALVALLTEDVTWSVAPRAHRYAGLGPVTASARAVPRSGSCGAWRPLPATADGQPAVATYPRAPDAAAGAPHTAWSIDVLTPARRPDRRGHLVPRARAPRGVRAAGVPSVSRP